MRRLLSVLLLIFLVSGSLLYAEDPADIYEKAENRYKKGNYELALKLYGDLIKEFPLSRYVPESAFRIAVIQVYTGDFSGAEKSFEEIEKGTDTEGFRLIFFSGRVLSITVRGCWMKRLNSLRSIWKRGKRDISEMQYITKPEVNMSFPVYPRLRKLFLSLEET